MLHFHRASFLCGSGSYRGALVPGVSKYQLSHFSFQISGLGYCSSLDVLISVLHCFLLLASLYFYIFFYWTTWHGLCLPNFTWSFLSSLEWTNEWKWLDIITNPLKTKDEGSNPREEKKITNGTWKCVRSYFQKEEKNLHNEASKSVRSINFVSYTLLFLCKPSFWTHLKQLNLWYRWILFCNTTSGM